MFITFTSLGQLFAQIIASLCTHVATGVAADRARAPLLSIVYYRLVRMLHRLDRLALRWQQGTLPKPRPSRAGQPRPAPPQPNPAPDPAAARPPRIPTRHAWLLHLHQPTAQLREQIALLLATPQFASLLAAAPQAGRIMRPLCHMLAIPIPPPLQLPQRPQRPRPQRARGPRHKTPPWQAPWLLPQRVSQLPGPVRMHLPNHIPKISTE